jgi:hypothetical protein
MLRYRRHVAPRPHPIGEQEKGHALSFAATRREDGAGLAT